MRRKRSKSKSKYKGSKYGQGKREELKLMISRSHEILGCWRFEEWYKVIEERTLHREWARGGSGNGEIVRHLCSDNRCVNPLHLVYGNDVENADDEIKVRDYSVEVLQNLIGEVYNDKFSNHKSMLILIPRVSRMFKYRFDSLSSVARYAREEYRRHYELITAQRFNIEYDIDMLANLRRKFIWLASKNYIKLTMID